MFEIGWWGEGLGEAAGYIDRTAPRGATVAVMADPSHVFTLRPDLRRVHPSKRPDYVIYNNLLNGPFSLAGYRQAYVVDAGGAPLCWVYARAR